VELGASVPTKGLYFVTGQMEKMEEIVAAWAAENLAVLRLLQPLVMGMLGKNPETDVQTASDASATVSTGAGA
jgi:FMN reductase